MRCANKTRTSGEAWTWWVQAWKACSKFEHVLHAFTLWTSNMALNDLFSKIFAFIYKSQCFLINLKYGVHFILLHLVLGSYWTLLVMKDISLDTKYFETTLHNYLHLFAKSILSVLLQSHVLSLHMISNPNNKSLNTARRILLWWDARLTVVQQVWLLTNKKMHTPE